MSCCAFSGSLHLCLVQDLVEQGAFTPGRRQICDSDLDQEFRNSSLCHPKKSFYGSAFVRLPTGLKTWYASLTCCMSPYGMWVCTILTKIHPSWSNLMHGPHRNAPSFPGVSYSPIQFSYSIYVYVVSPRLTHLFSSAFSVLNVMQVCSN